jgi:quinol-cytochrome oxidoreductase complex cytochrome b subunit
MAQFEGRSVDDPVPTSSQAPRFYWLTVLIVGVVEVLVVLGAVALAWQGKPVPEGIQGIGASGMMALAFLLRPAGASA